MHTYNMQTLKKPGVAVLMSDKADLKARKVVRNKDGHYVMVKGLIL